jgi:hypothetical protein
MDAFVGIILGLLAVIAFVAWRRKRLDMPIDDGFDADLLYDDPEDDDDPEARKAEPEKWMSRAPRWGEDGPPITPPGGGVPGDM